MDKELIKQQYIDACNAYLEAFCEKYDFDYDDAKDSWVAGCVGDTCLCGDYYITLEEMITDIENNAPKGEFLKYYEYSLECHEYGLFSPNYSSWLRGCPRLSDEQRKSIREAKNRVELAKKELEKCIEEQRAALAGGF